MRTRTFINGSTLLQAKARCRIVKLVGVVVIPADAAQGQAIHLGERIVAVLRNSDPGYIEVESDDASGLHWPTAEVIEN